MAGTPCSAGARSCVDLESQQAWLIADGKVVRGPVKVSSGGAGKETPVGHSFRVYRKEKDHKSGEFLLADALAEGRRAIEGFYDDAETNFMGTLNVLRCAVAAGVKKLVFASSMVTLSKSSNQVINSRAWRAQKASRSAAASS